VIPAANDRALTNAFRRPERIAAQVINMGDYDDVQDLVNVGGKAFLQRVLRSVEIGQFNASALHYWHYLLGLADLRTVPPLQTRRRCTSAQLLWQNPKSTSTGIAILVCWHRALRSGLRRWLLPHRRNRRRRRPLQPPRARARAGWHRWAMRGVTIVGMTTSWPIPAKAGACAPRATGGARWGLRHNSATMFSPGWSRSEQVRAGPAIR